MRLYISIVLFGIFSNSCNSQNQKENLLSTRINLEKVFANDQKYRNADYNKNLKLQDSLDKKNLQIVSQIIDSLGWLGKELVGDSANDAFFLVIQHSNKETMEKYLPIMRKAVAENKAKKQSLVLLIDRVEMLNNRKQIYGSQVYSKDSSFFFYDVTEPEKLNYRRKEMGLENIEEYLKRFNK